MPENPENLLDIAESDPGWPAEFSRLSAALSQALDGVAIEHIGSTAVPGLASRPVLDLVIALENANDATRIRNALETLGYIAATKDGDGEAFRRGSAATPSCGAGMWMDHALFLATGTGQFMADARQFRDYLITHRPAADSYGILKRSLSTAFRDDPESYAAAREPFIKASLAAARDVAPLAPPALQVSSPVMSEVDMRVGTVLRASRLEKAREPALVLSIDFGPLGILTSSARITDHYSPVTVLGRQVVAITNLPPRQIASVMSRCLVLGASDGDGIALLAIERAVPNGARVY